MKSLRLADIGGQDESILKLMDFVEVSKRGSQINQKLGVKPYHPESFSSLLLQGPKGNGKRTLATALANEMEMSFIYLSSHRVIVSQVSVLEHSFKEAESKSPCILYIDDLEIIASKQKSKSERERKVFSRLVDLLDETKDVIIIGGTTNAELINIRLMENGRFQNTIIVPPPDERGRLEILQILTKEMKFAEENSDVSLEKLASMTRGCVASDLSKLCSRAGQIAYLERKKEILENPEVMDELFLTQSHFEKSVSDLGLSRHRHEDQVDLTMEDVGGLEMVKRELKMVIHECLIFKKVHERYKNVKPFNCLLLYGPTGCGKTMITKCLGNDVEKEHGFQFHQINCVDLLGLRNEEIGMKLNTPLSTKPLILFLDDIHALVRVRGQSPNSPSGMKIDLCLKNLLGHLVRKIDSFLCILATNRPDMIDRSIKEIVTHHIYVPLPDRQGRIDILKVRTRNLPVQLNVDFDEIARVTDGYCGHDLSEIVSRATKLAIREGIQSINQEEEEEEEEGTFLSSRSRRKKKGLEEKMVDRMYIGRHHFEESMRCSRRRVGDSDLHRYRYFAEEMSMNAVEVRRFRFAPRNNDRDDEPHVDEILDDGLYNDD